MYDKPSRLKKKTVTFIDLTLNFSQVSFALISGPKSLKIVISKFGGGGGGL